MRIRTLWAASTLLLVVAAAKAEQAITLEELERLHGENRPRKDESPWAKIAWMYDLHKARQKAAQEGKPLCVWRMAGDPTGVC
jgi:hypothetical protein